MTTPQQKYYQKNRDKIIAKVLKYQREHPVTRRKHARTYNRKHKVKLNEYQKVYKKEKYNTDAKIRLKQIMKTRHSQFLNGKYEPFIKYVGISSDKYRAYIESLLPADWGWKDYRKRWFIGRKDEFIDMDLLDSIKNFFYYTNVKIKFKD